LRRNADPLDLVFVAAFRRLQNDLGAHDDRTLRRAAMMAHVLAHVREDDEIRFARALGSPRGDEKAAMSETRFRRLLQARDDADLTRRLVRAVKMLKGKANVVDLAWAIWFWNDRARQIWMFDYFAADPPADRTAA
jgi:CRISPR system Cascade subunit CasB